MEYYRGFSMIVHMLFVALFLVDWIYLGKTLAARICRLGGYFTEVVPPALFSVVALFILHLTIPYTTVPGNNHGRR